MPKVRVWVPFHTTVPYIVEVRNPKDIEEIKDALKKKDAADWEYQPDFYDIFGLDFYDLVEEISLEDVEVVEE